MVQIRIPKSEIRNKSEIRIPKSQTKTRRAVVTDFSYLVLRICFGFRISRFGFLLVPAGAAELALDVAGDHLDGEEVADAAEFGVLLELAQVGERHAGLQFGQALGGHLAVLHELRVALEDRFREQLAAR